MTDSPLSDQISVQQPHDTKSPPLHPLPSPTSLSQSSNSQLASLLTDAFKEVESLRRELAAVRKRADDAERKYRALSSVSDPKATQADTARVIQEFEVRALEAEAARDDADSRRRSLIETWHQLDRYLHTVELRAADARAGFSKIVSEGGGQLILASIPLPGGVPLPVSYPALGSMPPPYGHSRATLHSASSGHSSLNANRSAPPTSFPPLSLPPHPPPNPNGNGRRPRDESVDRHGYAENVPGQPPNKKLKGYGDDRRGRDERTSYSESSLAYLHQRHQPLPTQVIESRDRIYQDRRMPQARMIVPPTGEGGEYTNHRGRSRSRSRSSSRSTESSLSVDEMLLQATGEAANGTLVPGSPSQPSASSQRTSHPHRRHRAHREYGHRYATTSATISNDGPTAAAPSQQIIHPQRSHPDSPPHSQQGFQNYRPRGTHSSPSVPLVTENHVNSLPTPCHVQTIQTHVFAPVVTGAPTKKNKFSASGGSAGNLAANANSNATGEAPPPAPPAHVFPPTNNQGQRICRQCGMPGRYKEGKCVEKWGPGPMGPGTVCDRCRKKMKRVERRGTLETQQLAASNSLTALQQQQQAQAQAQAQAASSTAATTTAAAASSQSQSQSQGQGPPHPPPQRGGGGGNNAVVQLQQTQPVSAHAAERNIMRQDTIVSPQVTPNHTGSSSVGGQQHHGYVSHREHGERERERGDRGDRERERDRDREDSDARSALVAAVSSSSAESRQTGGGGVKGGYLHGAAGGHSHKGGAGGRMPPSPPPAIASINDELPISNVGRGGSMSRGH
ncbi:hypothetical protein AMATHDRAFT_68400, partial [Amanita thiersii Skay4041]